MGDRIEDRRQEQAQLQKKQQDMRTVKEKALAAEKFKTAFSQKTVAEQKSSSSNQKKQGEKQSGEKAAQNAFLARQGISGRSMAERMVTAREGDKQLGERVSEGREKSFHETDFKESATQEEKSEAKQQERQIDAPIQRRDDGQQQGQPQGQSQGRQSGGQSGGQSQQQEQRRDEGMGIAASGSGAPSAGGANESSGGKIAIGRTEKMAAKERISSKVLQDIVESIYKGSQQGMHDFHIQLKDDALGGGSLRVTLKDGKLKVLFTLKDNNAKNLIESSKGVLMRMFERKGLALESLEVKLRA